jgi:hypothetical protein
MKKKTSKQVLKKSPKVKKDTDSVGTVESVLSIIDPSIAEPIKTPEVTRKLKPKEKIHYVNSREFEEEIRTYYKSGDVSIKLGESITKIAHGLSFAPNFINYSYKDDMIGDAIVKMFSALRNKKFKLDSGFSPFSYFTTIAFHAFINRIKKEKAKDIQICFIAVNKKGDFGAYSLHKGFNFAVHTNEGNKLHESKSLD